MDGEEAESEFVDADIDGDDLVRWNEYVEEFYGLEPADQNNILQMGILNSKSIETYLLQRHRYRHRIQQNVRPW